MKRAELLKRLERAKDAADFINAQYELSADLGAAGLDAGTVTTILRFMEANPELDFGTPGPLVHFVEGLPRDEYDPLLVASVSRKPTRHTLWLLNRVLNATNAGADREKLIGLLRTVAHDSTDRFVREAARDYLKLQSSGP
jgi:hypothetical protein